MDVRIFPVEFADIAEEVRDRVAGLPAPIDSFLEDRILASRHYRLEVTGAAIGFTSIHDHRLITQFAIRRSYQALGQVAFAQVRRTDEARSAYVPTCDEFFLSHALDDYRQLAKQAYFFQAVDGAPQHVVVDNYEMRPATPDDVAALREETGNFFDPLEERIASGELFITMRDTRPVGFGVLVPSTLQDAVASIGMFTVAAFRGQGVGTATISLLMKECHRRGRRSVAGCWYFNHGSKRTLERAGMVSRTRLLRIDY